jgi:hypothetical protein
VRKVTRKLNPLIDFKQKLRDLEVGHEGESFILELLRLLGHRLLKWTYLEQFTCNFSIRQLAIARELIDLVQLLFQECKTRSQVAFRRQFLDQRCGRAYRRSDR